MIEGLFQAAHYLCARFTQGCTLWVIYLVGMSLKFVAQFADFLMQFFYFFVVVHKMLLIYRPILHHAETPNSKNSHSNKFLDCGPPRWRGPFVQAALVWLYVMEPPFALS